MTSVTFIEGKRTMKNKYIITALLLSLIMVLSAVSPGNLANAKTTAAQEGAACGIERGLDIVFAIDESGSMVSNDGSGIRKTAAKNMVDQLRPLDRFGVVGFNHEAKKYQQLTEDKNAAKSAIDQLGNNGGTMVSEGLQIALNEIKDRSYNNHKIIVLLTDGDSPDSAQSLALADQAAKDGVMIYTIGLGNTANINVPVLTDIAQKTNGTYYHALNAPQLTNIFATITQTVNSLREPKIPSNWTLTKDYHATGDLVLQENMVMDLNGYNLTVDGQLVLMPCAELRAVSGEVRAVTVEQNRGSLIRLNNSALHVEKFINQNGVIQVNGDYSDGSPELQFSLYNQGRGGVIELNGNKAIMASSEKQQGTILLGNGNLEISGDFVQNGSIDLQGGTMSVGGNLTIAGGLLIDKEFKENDSLDVNGGLLQVGSQTSLDSDRSKGNVKQTSGQLNVNHGSVRIFGDYSIADGWLTMTKGSMDTSSPDYGEGDGDYVHVYRNFTMASLRNHGGRSYNELMKPKDDWPHLTDGVLVVDGSFVQRGDAEYHTKYSDRSQNYTQAFSRYNFQAGGRHKVILTGKESKLIQTEGARFTFENLQVTGFITDYIRNYTGQTKWKNLLEVNPASKGLLASLTISGVPVHNFNPTKLSYYNHAISRDTITSPVQEFVVDARAQDHRNAKVKVTGNTLGSDGTALVKVVVTAADGSNTVYTIGVTANQSSPDAVGSLILDRNQLLFVQEGSGFSPKRETIGATIQPTTALNQQVLWTSSNPSVATVLGGVVTPISAGSTTITAETVDGGFIQTVAVEVRPKNITVQGVKTLADLVSDTARYNTIMALYDHKKIGIVVPGSYISNLTFNQVGQHVTGTIETSGVDTISISVNGQTLPSTSTGSTFIFQRIGIQPGDFIEIKAFNTSGDLLETIKQSYSLNYQPSKLVNPGFYSIERLIQNPVLFGQILQGYSAGSLLFEVR